MQLTSTRTAAAISAVICLTPGAARADFATARQAYEVLPIHQQTSAGLALIATGDFEGLVEFGFSRRLYRALRAFERRHGLPVDGILSTRERRLLAEEANRFFTEIGTEYEEHPASGARLLVPHKLFDSRKPTADGSIYERADGAMSLSFISFESRQKDYDDLYGAMSASGADRRIIYTRKFKSHFVVTGMFHGRKFYSWMSRGKAYTTGFAYSWNDASDAMGRKISTLLANSFIGGAR